MAILAIVTGDGFTKEMYEQLRREVDWEHKHPTGVIFHAASFDNSGNNIRVLTSGSLNKILITFLIVD
jgi:hypothetical protein